VFKLVRELVERREERPLLDVVPEASALSRIDPPPLTRSDPVYAMTAAM